MALAPLSRRVERFARKTATAVKLEDLYAWASGDLNTRLEMAQFMHQEIAIRNAQLCKELKLLPFGLDRTQGVNDVVRCFGSYVDWLDECPPPVTEDADRAFTRLLQEILEDHTEVVGCLGRGVLEVKERMGAAAYDEIRPEMSLILDRFFIKRVGLRFLIQHHIESAEVRPGVRGIIHDDVAVGGILREAAASAQETCRARVGAAPEIVVLGDGQPALLAGGRRRGQQLTGLGCSHSGRMNLSFERRFTYVPMHLKFVCLELLANACFATVRHWQSQGSRGDLPPVYAIFAHGEDEVSLKVSDEGGGIARSEIHLAWSYFDGASASWTDSDAIKAQSKDSVGAGLPLSRLHTRYYGGDLQLKSMEGFGTDVYVFLNRLGQSCENLPHGVRVSPAQRDSSVGSGASIQLESLGTMSEPEVAILKRRLQEYRLKRQGSGSDIDYSDTE